jgi:molecular chaperone HtpG
MTDTATLDTPAVEASQKETLGFQTEVKQLLHLMINALYSNKEIFLRELISNAADASDKLRFLALSDNSLLGNDPDLKLRLSFDEKNHTLTLADNGIGMSREEVITNLGTIAKSGTKEFMASLTGDQAKDSKLIGQFGVGFYSAFIVADKVTVETRRAGLGAEEAVRWESNADGNYTLEKINKPERGTTIILHLKKEDQELLSEWRLRQIVKKYSDHINLPVVMKVKKSEEDKSVEVKEGDAIPTKEVEVDETLNEANALWTLPKSKITDDEYKSFYKSFSHDYSDPLLWTHNKVEGKLEYTLLLYLPSRAPFDLYEAERKHGLKLYIQRVFIMDDAEQFLPRYLRFVKGIVDSKDLPLNISREILQQSDVVDKIKGACVKRTLDMIEKIAENAVQYADFWKQFGNVMKEGTLEDHDNKERISKLLRFATTQSDSEVQGTSLDEYVARMKPEQEKIYYVTAETFLAAKQSPHLEIFKKKGIEVLLLTDRIDEWLVGHLTEFNGKKLQSVSKGDLDLGKLADEEDKKVEEKQKDDFAEILKKMKEVLGAQVSDVRLTHRLTTSPACVVVSENDMTLQMQRMFQQAGQTMPMSKPIFEINPEHDLIKNLSGLLEDEKFADWSEVLFAEAVLAEGGKLPDPVSFVNRVNKLLSK